jgi:hypothetical protein
MCRGTSSEVGPRPGQTGRYKTSVMCTTETDEVKHPTLTFFQVASGRQFPSSHDFLLPALDQAAKRTGELPLVGKWDREVVI